jgi:hypothetical protein
VILGEREPVAAEEPLIISASLEGLKKVISRLAELREASSGNMLNTRFSWPKSGKIYKA